MTTTQRAYQDQQLPALTKIGGVWHCVIANKLFKVTKPGRTWTVARADDAADPQPVASGRTRKEALAAALTALSVSLALPEPTITHVGSRLNALGGGATITIDGLVSVFYRLEKGDTPSRAASAAARGTSTATTTSRAASASTARVTEPSGPRCPLSTGSKT